MKAILPVFIVILVACESKQVDSTLKGNSKEANSKNSTSSEIEQVRKTYSVGDINNDNVADTATVIFVRDYSIDEIVCDQKNCPILISFGRHISELSIDQSLGVVVQKTKDLNKDKANEILIFSRTYRGWWNDISLWSFKNQKWLKIAKTEGFISEDKDFNNRIIQENENFYLVGDGWDNDKGVTERTEKVKI